LIKKNITLQPYNTFGINVKAKSFAVVEHIANLKKIISSPQHKDIHIIGGGSNILFTKDIEGLLIKINIQGIHFIKKSKGYIYLKVGAGVIWHHFVLYCLYHNYGGIENLISIPGTVGAAPIQNIGAYGVSFSNVFVSLTALDIEGKKLCEFKKQDCNFGYRNSIFKKNKHAYIIVDVTFKLSLPAQHQLYTQYGIIQSTLAKMAVKQNTIQNVGRAIMEIRKSKLPNPKKLGNAGSFFQNPIISKKKYIALQKKYPQIQGYAMSNNQVKVSAAWLIESCGWKGKKENSVGIYAQHSLIIVHYGQAAGQEVYLFAKRIQQNVKQKMGILLMFEVNIW